MSLRNLIARAVSLVSVSLAATLIAAPQTEKAIKIIDVEIQFEAGSGYFEPWDSGTTIHSGVGYLHPFGASDYWCGIGYEEEREFPKIRESADFITNNAIDSNPLFCIYKTEEGSIYALDVLVGSIFRDDKNGERVDSVVNLIVGGTGLFENATGLWVGTTAGRGEMEEVAPDFHLPASILKLMDGYVRLLRESSE